MGRLRRLASMWCLAALALGEVAQAKVLIIRNHNPGSTADEQSALINRPRTTRILESVVKSTGGTIRTVLSSKSRTEWARTGAQVWNPGTAGAYVEQFDAVVIPHSIEATAAGQARADSLSRLTVQGRGGATVPVLVYRDNGPNLAILGDQTSWGTTVDSLGVGTLGAGPGKAFWQKGTTQAFQSHAYVGGAVGLYETGDKRNILFAGAPQYYSTRSSSDDNGGLPACAWCDSMATYADVDTVVLWERQYGTRFPGASTMVVVDAYGPGGLVDSSANLGEGVAPPTEGDFALTFAALARLDSLVRSTSTTGGKVLGDKTITVAPIVYGGLTRGPRHAWKSPGSPQGIAAADTASFYAIIDSLKANGIPVTFAVDVGNATTYARDIIKMKEHPLAKFTPQIWNSVDLLSVAGTDTSGGAVVNQFYSPADVFGRYRKRAAYGDSAHHRVNGADTTVHWLAKRALAITDSIFGKSRVSRVAVAPDDDWSPKNLTGLDKGGLGVDSLLYALQRAGYVGVVADAQDPDASALKRVGPSATNPRGYYNRQQRYRARFSSQDGSGADIDMKILAHSGYSIMGGRAQSIAFNDSTISAAGLSLHAIEISRIWGGALLDYDDSEDTWDSWFTRAAQQPAYADIQRRKLDYTQKNPHRRPSVRANIYRLACADLSGVTNGPPAANGFHVLKAVKNAMDTINRLAGRTVVRFGYPEEIDP